MDSYYTDKTATFEQSRHDSLLAMSRSMRSLNQHEPSPAAEMDSKMRNPQRRRVPVACGRCRRRKIKCSGDSGDGQGCSNCRNAGNTDCQFLRVASASLKLTPQANGWPYPNPGAAVMPSPRLGMYTSTTAGKPTLLSMSSPQARMAAFQRASDYDLGTTDGSVFPERAAGTVESMPYEAGQSTSYSQSPAYMHPNAPAGTLFDYGGSPWSPKIWDSVLGVSKPSNGTIYPDPEANNSIAQSPFSYMLPSQALSSTEGQQSTTVAMANISSADLPGPDRTLPTPTCRSQQLPSALSGLVFSPTETTSSLSLPIEARPAFWSPRCGPPHDSRSPVHSIPSTILFSNSPPPTTRCPTTANPEIIFSGLPMPITTEEIMSSTLSPRTAPPSTTSTTASYAIDAHDNTTETRTLSSNTPTTQVPVSTSTGRSLTRGIYGHDRTTTAQRLVELTTDCTQDIYSYASSEKSKRTGDGRNAGANAQPGAFFWDAS
ncbi:uncharacterized protein N7496_000293 [Penicillium cataractarum]|uniref:Zn(2)-C6 fungal-type domain-containing protein n=1 Tax=Penicillium cataractarum TaxID=2100454 RepID=A0A9X0B5V1_9EURO|nr:uncharacterized protein N7496_000293 [Penicillium cataractarum]KAJ5389225.1 hypothetical protein N7496_000293 [Penicillium cataractarum]